MVSRQLTLALVVAVQSYLALCSPGLASAQQEPPGYRATIDQALQEFEARNFEEALALFAKAHQLYPNARTLRALSMTEFELKRYALSITHMEQALASTRRPLEGPMRQKAEELLARAKGFVSRVIVSVSPQVEAQILVDDIPTRPAADGTLLLKIGEHVIEVRADGYRSLRRKLTVRGGRTRRLQLALESEAKSAPAAALTATPGLPRRGEADESSVWQSPWLWLGGALAAGAAVTVWLATTNGGAKTVVADPITTPNSPPGVVVMALQ